MKPKGPTELGVIACEAGIRISRLSGQAEVAVAFLVFFWKSWRVALATGSIVSW